MIKLIIFDLDGVLVETKDLHYESLNLALSKIHNKYIINEDEHHQIYDGLSTRVKLKLLTENKNLSIEHYDRIFNDKQNITFDLIRNNIKEDLRLKNIFKRLKEEGYVIYVASNAIRETVKLLLYKTGLIEYTGYYLSNEDVNNPKPHSEIYLRCMIHAGFDPKDTLIIEDSPRGIESAKRSGANLLIVKNPNDLTYDKVIYKLKENKVDVMNNIEIKDLNILIPMAGAGSRFEKAGYTFPKPLIEVFGKPMIQFVVENLGFKANYIYIVRKEHYEKYNLQYLLNLITPNCKIVQVDHLTEGAACTTLLAEEYIDNDKMLLIANSDQYVEWNPIDFYYKMVETKSDGGILTFKSTHPKWSFVKLDDWGNVIEVAEKKPISDNATVGIYYWCKGSDYIKYAKQMIEKDIRVNSEFYVAPVYNEAILDKKRIRTFNIEKMWGIGTPEDLNIFLKNNNF